MRYSAPSSDAQRAPYTPHTGLQMTLPTPTAAPEAPPLPHRGEGMGVGGHFRRLRIHGAPWLAVTLALTTPTHRKAHP